MRDVKVIDRHLCSINTKPKKRFFLLFLGILLDTFSIDAFRRVVCLIEKTDFLQSDKIQPNKGEAKTEDT